MKFVLVLHEMALFCLYLWSGFVFAIEVTDYFGQLFFYITKRHFLLLQVLAAHQQIIRKKYE